MENDILKILEVLGEDINFKNGERIVEEDERLAKFEVERQKNWRPGVITHRNGRKYKCNLIIDMNIHIVFAAVGKPYSTIVRTGVAKTHAYNLGLPIFEVEEIKTDYEATGRHKVWRVIRPYGKIITFLRANVANIEYAGEMPQRPTEIEDLSRPTWGGRKDPFDYLYGYGRYDLPPQFDIDYRQE